MLVLVTMSAFCFHIPMWLPWSLMEAQLLGFAPLQPSGVYSWQAYLLPGAGPWPT